MDWKSRVPPVNACATAPKAAPHSAPTVVATRMTANQFCVDEDREEQADQQPEPRAAQRSRPGRARDGPATQDALYETHVFADDRYLVDRELVVRQKVHRALRGEVVLVRGHRDTPVRVTQVGIGHHVLPIRRSRPVFRPSS